MLKQAITWFIDNPVATNLLMGVLVVGGIVALPSIHKEEFPSIATDTVSINVQYLGASPVEVEEGICLRIEEKIDGLPGIKKMTTMANEGSCGVYVDLLSDIDKSKVTQDIKNRVDSITTFPVEAERPQVSEITITQPVLQVAISGPANERELKELGKRTRDDLVALSSVSQVELLYTRPYEISIEISKHQLSRYGITLNDVADVIRKSSLNTPGGAVYTKDGEVLIRTDDKSYWGEQFEQIIIMSTPEGGDVRLTDVAKINDQFEHGYLDARFNDGPAVLLQVSRVGNEDTITIAEQVKEYVAAKQGELPRGIELTVWRDDSEQLLNRINTLNKNALSGLLLVLAILALFLKFRLALWVSAGIPISVLGALMLFPSAGIAISTLSVMAFILVLGILVDDAIVVGERVYAFESQGLNRREAAIKGTQEVAVPVIFGVLTTMATFTPMLLVDSTMGKFFAVISATVILCLAMSLIESTLVLPGHLAHRGRGINSPTGTKPEKKQNAFGRLQESFNDKLDTFVGERYQNFLSGAIKYRYVTLSVAFSVVLVAVGLVASGRIVFQFFPAVEGDRIYASLTMQEGVSVHETQRVLDRIENAAITLEAEMQATLPADAPPIVKNRLMVVGDEMFKGDMNFGPPTGPRSHIGDYGIEVVPASMRPGVNTKEAALRWQELVGPVPEAVQLTFSADAFGAGDPILLQMRGRNIDDLRSAANDVKAKLSEFEGVYGISDSFRAGKQEIRLRLKDSARSLGLTLSSLGQQVRHAFYGAEVFRMQRGQDEVKVMVRLTESERESISSLETMFIRTPQGDEVPFASVAEVDYGRGYSSIRREDRQRIVSVKANVDRSLVSPEQVLESMMQVELPKILTKYPGVTYGLAGEAEERATSMGGLAQGFLMAMLVVYGLLAIPLKSYAQPLVIMSVIPFGAIGAVIGHFIMGIDLVFFSLMGIIALAGVVINSSLVLVDYVNRQREVGVHMREAVLKAGQVRFRPILLTSLTTFFGLVPLMSSGDPSTYFMVPMAVSLAFGLLLATSITLILVPALYVILHDAINLRHLISTKIRALYQ